MINNFADQIFDHLIKKYGQEYVAMVEEEKSRKIGFVIWVGRNCKCKPKEKCDKCSLLNEQILFENLDEIGKMFKKEGFKKVEIQDVKPSRIKFTFYLVVGFKDELLS